MELFRGWNSCYAPAATGQVRLCKATVYRDVDIRGARDEREGDTRVHVEGRVTRTGGEPFGLGEETITLVQGGEVTGVAHLERGCAETTFKQEVSVDVHPVPYVFCASRNPESPEGEEALRAFLTKDRDYDAWFRIKDAEALDRELCKAIKGWLFDREVSQHLLAHRHGWVSYYDGEKPKVVADLAEDGWGADVTHHIDSMNAWFSKRRRFAPEKEYRFAYVVESPELEPLPDFMVLDLTVSAVRLFERLPDR